MFIVITFSSGQSAKKPSYPIVDTGQFWCYDNDSSIPCPETGDPFYGQDAQYDGVPMAYRDNGDGTITDLGTGLMWASSLGEKKTWDDAVEGAERYRLAGHKDWRLPTIKELYSLTNFSGGFHRSVADSTPYIDTNYFEFSYGNASLGERPIDVQVWSATQYVGTTMNRQATVFGVNFADGRINGYPKFDPRRRENKRLFVRYVRGNPDYGKNDFVDNHDGTITDRATGLTWQKADDDETRNWEDALSYCEGLRLGGRTDWRLPNAKELQSIVDYSRAPTVTETAAIDPIFQVSVKESYFWTSTTHLDGPMDRMAETAVYVAFGRAMGYMRIPPHSRDRRFIDVHGAGAQRSDPKTGDPNRFPNGRGPQGDDIRIYNYVRCVHSDTGLH
jgi:hypothetical protein